MGLTYNITKTITSGSNNKTNFHYTVTVETPNIKEADIKELIEKEKHILGDREITIRQGGSNHSGLRGINVFCKNGTTILQITYITSSSQFEEIIQNDFEKILSHLVAMIEVFNK